MRNATVVLTVLVVAYASTPNRAAGAPPAAQQAARACLHGDDEVPEQRERRLQALAAARDVNTAQAAAGARTGVFQPLLNLPLTRAVPPGFRLQLSNDGVTYAFSVKDTTDPCLFAYFSDQTGIILVGRAIQ
jgi:hypothetical protein